MVFGLLSKADGYTGICLVFRVGINMSGGAMSKNWVLSCLMGCVFIVTAGMGSLGEQRTIEAPEPDTLYSATLIDQSDVSMKLQKVSCNGQTYLFGYKGRSQLSIDFDKIRAIFFFLKDDKIQADVTLSDDSSVEILVEEDIPWHGVSAYADVRIDTKDIKKITFHGLTRSE